MENKTEENTIYKRCSKKKKILHICKIYGFKLFYKRFTLPGKSIYLCVENVTLTFYDNNLFLSITQFFYDLL